MKSQGLAGFVMAAFGLLLLGPFVAGAPLVSGDESAEYVGVATLRDLDDQPVAGLVVCQDIVGSGSPGLGGACDLDCAPGFSYCTVYVEDDAVVPEWWAGADLDGDGFTETDCTDGVVRGTALTIGCDSAITVFLAQGTHGLISVQGGNSPVEFCAALQEPDLSKVGSHFVRGNTGFASQKCIYRGQDPERYRIRNAGTGLMDEMAVEVYSDGLLIETLGVRDSIDVQGTHMKVKGTEAGKQTTVISEGEKALLVRGETSVKGTGGKLVYVGDDLKRYRIRNAPAVGGMGVEVYADGGFAGTLQPTDSVDVQAQTIWLKGTDATKTATVFFTRLN